MKTTIMTIALAIAGMGLMSAQTPAPAGTTDKPSATTPAKAKKHKKVVKKTSKSQAVKTPAAPVAPGK